jgi:hypothetical protein
VSGFNWNGPATQKKTKNKKNKKHIKQNKNRWPWMGITFLEIIETKMKCACVQN